MDDLWGEEPDWAKDDLEADDDDEEEATGPALSPASHVEILIDCSSFENTLQDPEFPKEQISPVAWTIHAILQILKAKTRTVTIQKTGKRDGIGVLLYNTKLRTPIIHDDEQETNDTKPSKQESEKMEGDDDEDDEEEDELFGHTGPQLSTVHELLPLAPPGVPAIVKLKSTQEDPFTGECPLNLKEEYESTEPVSSTTTPSLQMAVNTALQTFSNAPCVRQRPNKNQAPDEKQIWIFTNQDCPMEGTFTEVFRETVQDAHESNVSVWVWPVVVVEEDHPSQFRSDRFFETVGIDTPLEEKTLSGLMDVFDGYFKKTRPAYRLPLLLPNWKETNKLKKEDPHIMLEFYKLTQTSSTPTKIPVHQETGQRLSKITQQVLHNSGGEVLMERRDFGTQQKSHTGSDRIRSYVEVGGEKVKLTEEDRSAMKRQGNGNQDFASLILLGFKDQNTAVPFYHAVEHSYFCYPTDATTAGSTDAFAHLHASMVRKKVVAIGELLVRVTATSRFVVMRPMECQMDEDGEDMLHPPGFIVTSFPFEDEMRTIDPDAGSKMLEEGEDIASDELVEAARDLIQNQTFDKGTVIGENFENAYIGRFWAYVESLALDEGMKADRKYDTEVDEEQILKRNGEQIDRFQQLLPDEPEPEKKSRKRKELVPDTSGVDWETMYSENALDQCKVPQLKSYLKSIGEPLSGNKATLIARVEAHMGKESTSVKMEE